MGREEEGAADVRVNSRINTLLLAILVKYAMYSVPEG